ncbi:hypothetical protein QJS66_03215 [Kocuria rhizophila]|nr:hypothetical protein QJS66_03215 [Kocuria rhizophila]
MVYLLQRWSDRGLAHLGACHRHRVRRPGRGRGGLQRPTIPVETVYLAALRRALQPDPRRQSVPGVDLTWWRPGGRSSPAASSWSWTWTPR